MSDQLKQSRLSNDDYFFKMRDDTMDFADKAMGKYFNFATEEGSNKIDPFLIIPGTEERNYFSNGEGGQTDDTNQATLGKLYQPAETAKEKKATVRKRIVPFNNKEQLKVATIYDEMINVESCFNPEMAMTPTQ